MKSHKTQLEDVTEAAFEAHEEYTRAIKEYRQAGRQVAKATLKMARCIGRLYKLLGRDTNAHVKEKFGYGATWVFNMRQLDKMQGDLDAALAWADEVDHPLAGHRSADRLVRIVTDYLNPEKYAAKRAAEDLRESAADGDEGDGDERRNEDDRDEDDGADDGADEGDGDEDDGDERRDGDGGEGNDDDGDDPRDNEARLIRELAAAKSRIRELEELLEAAEEDFKLLRNKIPADVWKTLEGLLAKNTDASWEKARDLAADYGWRLQDVEERLDADVH